MGTNSRFGSPTHLASTLVEQQNERTSGSCSISNPTRWQQFAEGVCVSQLAESIKRRLAGRGESAVGGLRFAELWRRLSQKKGLTNRWGVLQLLSSLHDTGTSRGANPKVPSNSSESPFACYFVSLSSTCSPPLHTLFTYFHTTYSSNYSFFTYLARASWQGAGCVTSQSIAALSAASKASAAPLPDNGPMSNGLEDLLENSLQIRKPVRTHTTPQQHACVWLKDEGRYMPAAIRSFPPSFLLSCPPSYSSLP